MEAKFAHRVADGLLSWGVLLFQQMVDGRLVVRARLCFCYSQVDGRGVETGMA